MNYHINKIHNILNYNSIIIKFKSGSFPAPPIVRAPSPKKPRKFKDTDQPWGHRRPRPKLSANFLSRVGKGQRAEPFYRVDISNRYLNIHQRLEVVYSSQTKPFPHPVTSNLMLFFF